jgi:hypothetical protein
MEAEIFLCATVQTDMGVKPRICLMGSQGFFSVAKAAGACYQPLTSIWYQR